MLGSPPLLCSCFQWDLREISVNEWREYDVLYPVLGYGVGGLIEMDLIKEMALAEVFVACRGEENKYLFSLASSAMLDAIKRSCLWSILQRLYCDCMVG